MISMIRRLENVGVVQLAGSNQLAVNSLDGVVDTLERLETFRHEQVGELVMNWLQLVHPAKNSLLVRIGGKIVRRSVMTRYVEKHVRVLRSSIFRAVR